jgi:hypothetical protein
MRAKITEIREWALGVGPWALGVGPWESVLNDFRGPPNQIIIETLYRSR